MPSTILDTDPNDDTLEVDHNTLLTFVLSSVGALLVIIIISVILFMLLKKKKLSSKKKNTCEGMKSICQFSLYVKG